MRHLALGKERSVATFNGRKGPTKIGLLICNGCHRNNIAQSTGCICSQIDTLSSVCHTRIVRDRFLIF